MKKQLLLSIILLIISISCTPNIVKTPIIGEKYIVHQVMIINDTLKYVEIYNASYPNENYFWVRVPIANELEELDSLKLNIKY